MTSTHNIENLIHLYTAALRQGALDRDSKRPARQTGKELQESLPNAKTADPRALALAYGAGWRLLEEKLTIGSIAYRQELEAQGQTSI